MSGARQVTFSRSCYRCEGVGPECKSEDDARRKRLSINWWLASRRKRTKRKLHTKTVKCDRAREMPICAALIYSIALFC